MKKRFLFVCICFSFSNLYAQTIENIHFNLYTDSLKKGFYNYINVDGKFSDGSWQPLDSNTLRFTANTGRFSGNDLFIDSSYTGDTVVIKVSLKKNPAVWKTVTVHIRKRGFDEPLKSENDVLKTRKRKEH